MIGFSHQTFRTMSADGRNFILIADVDYVARDGSVYSLPAGATSDGASTPAELWITLPPFGAYWQAAFLHDCAYRDTLLMKDGTRATLTKQRCDDLLLEAMEVGGVDVIQRTLIYSGVALGGENSFEADRKAGWASFMEDYHEF